MNDDRAKFEALTGDEARSIARSVATSASDSPSPVEYVLAGWNAALASAQAASAEPVAWRDHVEQRLLTWRQSFVNKSGDQLALDDFMDKRSLDDLIDFVCDEFTTPAPAVAPAAVTEALRKLVVMARTSGDDAGPDAELMAACDEASDILAALATRTPEPAAVTSEQKPLDDARLQLLFGDAIEGALAFGFQGSNQPPDGHWLARFWNIGNAERSRTPEPQAEPPKEFDRTNALREALSELLAVHTGPKLNDEGFSYRAVQKARAALAASPTPDEQRAQAAQEGVDWKLTDKQCDDAIREAGFAFVGPRDAAMLRGLCRAAIRAALAGRQQP